MYICIYPAFPSSVSPITCSETLYRRSGEKPQRQLWHIHCMRLIKSLIEGRKTTISDKNIGKWLPFPHPGPCPMMFCRSKNIERKVDIIVAKLKRGKAGEGILLRVSRDFWMGLYLNALMFVTYQHLKSSLFHKSNEELTNYV